MTASNSTASPTASAPSDQYSRDLGIASLVMSATLCLTAAPTLILSVLVWEFAYQSPPVVLLHAWLARIGVAIVFATALAAMSFAMRGIRAGKRVGRPAPLAWAGLVLGCLGLGVWVIAAIALLNTTESLLRLHG